MRKGRVIISVGSFFLVVFYIETLYPAINSLNWTQFSEDTGDGDNEKPLRILFVADPQLIGEIDVSQFGTLERWDSDRFLNIYYKTAYNFLKPQIVIFLGDLFDEGTKADFSQRKRYYERFRNIFSLQSEQKVIYIFIPGDNDIGGEKEPVYPDKIHFFNETFGDIGKSYLYKENGYDLQLIKISEIFSPNTLDSIHYSKLKIILTHDSCLQRLEKPCFSALKNLNSSLLVVSGHSHLSTYYRINRFGNEMPKIEYFKSFLKNENPQPFGSNLRIDLTAQGDLIHEITVPTCSYRMGVPDLGYGAVQLYKNGTADYTVYWLPSRFRQFCIYIAFYTISQLILYPWITWKIMSCFWRCLIKAKTIYRTVK